MRRLTETAAVDSAKYDRSYLFLLTESRCEECFCATTIYTSISMNWESEEKMAKDVSENEALYAALADDSDESDE